MGPSPSSHQKNLCCLSTEQAVWQMAILDGVRLAAADASNTCLMHGEPSARQPALSTWRFWLQLLPRKMCGQKPGEQALTSWDKPPVRPLRHHAPPPSGA